MHARVCDFEVIHHCQRRIASQRLHCAESLGVSCSTVSPGQACVRWKQSLDYLPSLPSTQRIEE